LPGPRRCSCCTRPGASPGTTAPWPGHCSRHARCMACSRRHWMRGSHCRAASRRWPTTTYSAWSHCSRRGRCICWAGRWAASSPRRWRCASTRSGARLASWCCWTLIPASAGGPSRNPMPSLHCGHCWRLPVMTRMRIRNWTAVNAFWRSCDVAVVHSAAYRMWCSMAWCAR
ncbi:hypothetical protein SM139_0834, partial [Stenotrophomonas maltophilia]